MCFFFNIDPSHNFHSTNKAYTTSSKIYWLQAYIVDLLLVAPARRLTCALRTGLINLLVFATHRFAYPITGPPALLLCNGLHTLTALQWSSPFSALELTLHFLPTPLTLPCNYSTGTNKHRLFSELTTEKSQPTFHRPTVHVCVYTPH